MKKIWLIVLVIFVVNAEQVEVTSDNFFADENKFVGEFTGNVNIKKGSDLLTADKVRIFFDKDKNPIKYVANGNAKIKALIKEKTYDGAGNELIYEPKENLYTINGNGFLHEIDSDKKVYGEFIQINQNSGTYSVKSDKKTNSVEKKPVKFIFQVEDKK
ncbi:MAG: lipopolysaccharide transport periplasmic protein LptA [Campylobacter sp.]